MYHCIKVYVLTLIIVDEEVISYEDLEKRMIECVLSSRKKDDRMCTFRVNYYNIHIAGPLWNTLHSLS